MIKKTARLALRVTAFVISSFLLVAVTLILARAMSVRNGPDLEWWHTEKISAEFSAKDRLTVTTLDQYLGKEADVFQELEALESKAATVGVSHRLNRYKKGNDAYPIKSGQNLNRSSQLHPATLKGGVLLLHGMTDSPYSLRKLADMFHAQGFYVLSLRLPGHGTIPAELDSMEWQVQDMWPGNLSRGSRFICLDILTVQAWRSNMPWTRSAKPGSEPPIVCFFCRR